jgi:hypothetical protein
MFNFRMRPWSAKNPACIRVPAAVEFPTDIKLLERIELSRAALPLNSIKPLRRPIAQSCLAQSSA